MKKTGILRSLLYSCVLVSGVVVGFLVANVTNVTQPANATPEIDFTMPSSDRFISQVPEAFREFTVPNPDLVELAREGAQLQSPAQQVLRPQIQLDTRPEIIIIIDDMGLDTAAFNRISKMPGPLTLSFLPYAPSVSDLAKKGSAAGHEIMLHLPMEPVSSSPDPGPNALLSDDAPQLFQEKLSKSLDGFSSYVGVNNHMGSKLTANREAMRLTMAELNKRKIYFVDSVTSGSSVAGEVAQEFGLPTYERDVFLDADHGQKGQINVKESLAELEKIAKEKGYAIAIAHPYPTTMDALEPWLVTAELRGFKLTTIKRKMSEEVTENINLSNLR